MMMMMMMMIMMGGWIDGEVCGRWSVVAPPRQEHTHARKKAQHPPFHHHPARVERMDRRRRSVQYTTLLVISRAPLSARTAGGVAAAEIAASPAPRAGAFPSNFASAV